MEYQKEMDNKWILSPDRKLTEIEKTLVWKKPTTHIETDAEYRICNEVKMNWNSCEMKISNILLEGDAGSGKTQLAKALSADFGLPYTKITCFADMDKSDILGSILPVQSESGDNSIEYKFYPSEIVRAYENGWLLEIQEPTVIRDAAVLMALNSALEQDGSINLPTRIVHRHPDFMVVITTNRGYNGCRPLNEALRDRVQHTEKMDLPSIPVMIERAISKTGYANREILKEFAEVIMLLDKTARTNALKGIAGMRSYLYWVTAVDQGVDIVESLYHKVIYKITTDSEELNILEDAMKKENILNKLEELSKNNLSEENKDIMEIKTEESMEVLDREDDIDRNDRKNKDAIKLRKVSNGEKEDDGEEKSSSTVKDELKTVEEESGESGEAFYHELEDEEKQKKDKQKDFRKKLNKEAREIVVGTIHEKTKLIVHRPEEKLGYKEEYDKICSELIPIIEEITRKTKPLLDHEISREISKGHVYGTKFHADRVVTQDFKYFSNERPPDETPSIAVALRVDESASMTASGRLETAKQAVVAVNEFCERLNIPLLIYGDTADKSKLEQMSLYSYIDFEEECINNKYTLMGISGRSNNRDGMAIKILSDKLLKSTAKTKLLISISDGQPKAMPNYTGELAVSDMRSTIKEYTRKGITFLAAAIGDDKEIIENIYGENCFLDISDLNKLPANLVSIIARYA